MDRYTFTKILDIIVPSITVGDLLAISPDLWKEAVDYVKTHCIPSFAATNEISAISPPHIEYSTPLCELRVTINGIHKELALLDDGSEIVIIREDIWKASQAKINSNVKMHMQTANGGIQHMPSCLEMLEIVIDGLKTWAHAFVIPDAPYRLLLGHPWQCLVRLKKDEDEEDVHIVICDPCNPSNLHRVTTTPRPFQGPAELLAFFTAVRESISHALQFASVPSMVITATQFSEETLRTQYTLDPTTPLHIRRWQIVSNQSLLRCLSMLASSDVSQKTPSSH